MKKALPRDSSRSRATSTFNSPPHRKWGSSGFIRYQTIPNVKGLIYTLREILQCHAARLSSLSAAAWISSSINSGALNRLNLVQVDHPSRGEEEGMTLPVGGLRIADHISAVVDAKGMTTLTAQSAEVFGGGGRVDRLDGRVRKP